MRRGMVTASESQTKRKEIHPIWRGIGCILIVVIPLMSYAVAVLIVEENTRRHWFPIPNELVVSLPVVVESTLPAWLIDDLLVKLLLAGALAVMFFGLFTIFYSLMYRLGGGYRLKPGDVPPIRQSSRKRR